MADIFISYSQNDRSKIKQLSQALEQQGFSVWWDRELLGGDNYADDIEHELMAAKSVIVSWSESGSKSRWVRDEAAVAADAGTLIAISIDGSNPPIGFRQFHCVDLSHWRGRVESDGFLEVVKAVSNRLNKTSPTDEHLNQTVTPSVFQERRSSNLPTEKSLSKIVAVLPFVNRSPDADDAFFADGIHDELLTQISKLVSIQVISRTSVMGYREVNKSIPAIALELGAAVILEGAVQRAGNRVRINVQLIDGQLDTNIWAEKYDRELTPENIFDIQSEITREIAQALETVLSAADEIVLNSHAPTNNLIAYDAYLRGKHKVRSEAAGKQDFQEAIAEFDHAIGVDPNFAEPYANKARAYLTIYWFFGWDTECVEKAKLSVERAKELAPNAIETLLAQAYYHYWGELDLVRAEQVLNNILEISPQNPEALACKSYVIRRNGRLVESIDTLRKAMHLDPMLIDIPMELSNTLSAIGRFEHASQMLQRVYTLAPRSNFTAIAMADAFYVAGQADQAYQKASMQVDAPDFVYYYRRAFHALNTTNPDYITFALNTWPKAYHGIPRFPETYSLYKAMGYLALNDKSQAESRLISIQQSLEGLNDSYPGGWMPEAPYYPVTLPGLMRDLVEVRSAVENYEANAKRDQWGKLYHYHAIAAAFLNCGEVDSALTYLEKLSVIFGVCCYLPMSITPAYKILENEPRYIALKMAYEKWELSSSNNSLFI